jgi:hypothetical protein
MVMLLARVAVKHGSPEFLGYSAGDSATCTVVCRCHVCKLIACPLPHGPLHGERAAPAHLVTNCAGWT